MVVAVAAAAMVVAAVAAATGAGRYGVVWCGVMRRVGRSHTSADESRLRLRVRMIGRPTYTYKES